MLELWRRIVFNMAVSNTDDHLRNHGFVLVKDGWSLSLLYDVNPNIYGNTLSLNIDSDNNLIDFNLALSVARMYGLSDAQALEELKEWLQRLIWGINRRCLMQMILCDKFLMRGNI